MVESGGQRLAFRHLLAACPFSRHKGTLSFVEYRPAYLPDPLFMNIGEAGVEEPMWVYLNFMQRVQREQWFIEHPIGIRQIARSLA
jgi:hypothetical protein